MEITYRRNEFSVQFQKGVVPHGGEAIAEFTVVALCVGVIQKSSMGISLGYT